MLLVTTLGATCMISIGLLIAALSGRWHSQCRDLADDAVVRCVVFVEGTHAWVQKVAQIFPLTHLIAATRAIMTEGATLSQAMLRCG